MVEEATNAERFLSAMQRNEEAPPDPKYLRQRIYDLQEGRQKMIDLQKPKAQPESEKLTVKRANSKTTDW